MCALMCVSFVVATRACHAADTQSANACASCAAEFDAYLQSAVEAASPAEREAKLQAWLSAHHARACEKCTSRRCSSPQAQRPMAKAAPSSQII